MATFFARWALFMHSSPHPLRGRRGRNAATLRQAPWPCCFIILLTVALRVLKYWTEHEKWWLPSLPSLVVLFKVEKFWSHASAPGLFRLTPWTITLVKEKEICMFTHDKCTLHTAPAVLSTSLSPRYVSYNQKDHKTGSVKQCVLPHFFTFLENIILIFFTLKNVQYFGLIIISWIPTFCRLCTEPSIWHVPILVHLFKFPLNTKDPVYKCF